MRHTTLAQNDMYADPIHLCVECTEKSTVKTLTTLFFVEEAPFDGPGLPIVALVFEVQVANIVLQSCKRHRNCLKFIFCTYSIIIIFLLEKLCGYTIFESNSLFLTCFLSFPFLSAKVITSAGLESWSWSSYHCLQVFLSSFSSSVVLPQADRRQTKNSLTGLFNNKYTVYNTIHDMCVWNSSNTCTYVLILL